MVKKKLSIKGLYNIEVRHFRGTTDEPEAKFCGWNAKKQYYYITETDKGFVATGRDHEDTICAATLAEINSTLRRTT